MKKVSNILFVLVLAVIFNTGCTKMPSLDRIASDDDDVIIAEEVGGITDTGNDEEHDTDDGITDPDNDEDHDKDQSK